MSMDSSSRGVTRFALVLLVLVGPARTLTAASSDAIGSEALRQIQVLLADKAARTPVQRKIDSNLIYASRMSLGIPVAPGMDALQTGVEVAPDGQTVVDVTARVSGPLLAAMQGARPTVPG